MIHFSKLPSPEQNNIVAWFKSRSAAANVAEFPHLADKLDRAHEIEFIGLNALDWNVIQRGYRRAGGTL